MSDAHSKKTLSSLSIAALGIVYGDIGTSPLYAFRESISGLAIQTDNILGILSLIFWALILVISVKYLSVVLRADNDGEGGILALMALLKTNNEIGTRIFFLIGIFGAGLMLGDGMITPAISVASAVDGLKVIAPSLSAWILPISCGILLALFMCQHFGTEKIGFTFGPIIFIWFVVLGILGVLQIIKAPIVLAAIEPQYAIEFIVKNGFHGYFLLSSIFLAVTGGEALYADIGHSGKKPIRASWFFVVLPALVLNYFGQGAYLLAHPLAISNPFYLISPIWFKIPLLVLAAMATVIASQAVISATFSLTKQAVLLGLYPKLTITQTSESEKGQVFVPQMNVILAVGTLLIMVIFKNSSAISHAYGIAVNLVMVLTTLLVAFAAYHRWHWNLGVILFVFGFFLLIDLSFLIANAEKITTGGWLPIVFAILCAYIMHTWHKGLNYLKSFYYPKKDDFAKNLQALHRNTTNTQTGVTAVFITDVYDQSGGCFMNFLKLSRSMPEKIFIVNYTVQNIPYISLSNRFQFTLLDDDICHLTLCYGFMDFISIPMALGAANTMNLLPFEIDIDNVTYFLEVPNIIASSQNKTHGMLWQKKLFVFLARNYSANLNIEFYQLPYEKTMAIGGYCSI